MNNVIVIDGTVGVGKSTLSEILSKELGIKFFEEEVVNNPLLDKFYYDKSRYAFPLQVYFLNKRFEQLKEAEKLDGCIMDRSIYGDILFAKLLAEEGSMSQEEFKIYEELLNNMLQHIHPPKLMIYLRSNTEDIIKKIRKRGREYEQVVELDYWERLNKHYKEFFKDYNLSKLLVIDVDNIDFVNNEKDREYVVELIKKNID